MKKLYKALIAIGVAARLIPSSRAIKKRLFNCLQKEKDEGRRGIARRLAQRVQGSGEKHAHIYAQIWKGECPQKELISLLDDPEIDQRDLLLWLIPPKRRSYDASDVVAIVTKIRRPELTPENMQNRTLWEFWNNMRDTILPWVEEGVNDGKIGNDTLFEVSKLPHSPFSQVAKELYERRRTARHNAVQH